MNKQRIIDFLAHLRYSRLCAFKVVDGEGIYSPVGSALLLYKDHTVLEIQEYIEDGKHMHAMVIARFGEEHMLEEFLTPTDLRHFEAFTKVALPK